MATVSAQTLGIPGRVLVSARQHHFIVDATESRGGKAEAPLAAELFLASLIGCGTVIVEETARNRQLPLRKVLFAVSAERSETDLGKFNAIHFDITVDGLSQSDAEACVEVYTRECPIFGLARNGTDVTLNIVANH